MKIEWTACDFSTTHQFVKSFNFDFPFKEEKYVALKMLDIERNKVEIAFGKFIRMANCYNIIINGHFGNDYDGWCKIIGYCFLEVPEE